MHSLLKAAHPLAGASDTLLTIPTRYNYMIFLPIWTFYIGVAVVSLTVSYIAASPNK